MRSFVRALALGCLVVSGPVWADNFEFHGTVNGSVATTDNENGVSNSDQKQATVLSDVRPGMLFTYNAPRHIHEILAEVDFLYNIRADKPDVTFRTGYKTFLITGPRSELDIATDASKGQVNALRISQPTDTPTTVLPAGQTDVEQGNANENGSYQLSKGTRIFQRVFGRYTGTSSEVQMARVTTTSYETGVGVGLDHRRKSNDFQLEAGASLVHLFRDDPMGVQMGSRIDNQLNPRGVLVWQHDISPRWSSSIDGGVEYVHPLHKLLGHDFSDPYNPGQTTRSDLFPIAGAILAYTDVWGRMQLSARRAVTPNLYIAQNTITDSANVTFALPLKFLDQDAYKRNPRFVGIGTAAVERIQLIDPAANELRGVFRVARADVSLAWSPHEGQTYAVRYEMTYQNGDTVGEMVVPSYVRNTVYFTFALRYPTQIQVRVPRRPEQSVRADKGDLSPIGAEPVVVDPTELLEGQGGSDK